MIDRETIENRTAEIRRRRSFLEDYVGTAYDDFIPQGPEDRAPDYYVALRHLQVALQACIDIAKHIIAAQNLETPREIKESFRILARRGIISKDLTNELEAAAGIRNILVHGYTTIDPRKIHQIIQEDLPDLEKFVKQIVSYLKESNEEPQQK